MSKVEAINLRPDSFSLEILQDGERLITIKRDGTVVVHKEGCEKQAAKSFYTALEFEGKNLYKKIEDLERELKEIRCQQI